MVGCSIRNCSSRSVKGGTLRFFSFPLNESVAKEWLRFCGPKTTVKNGRVCSNHFSPSDYIVSLQHVLMKETPRKLKPDVLPTLHIDNIDKRNANTSIDKSSASDISSPSCIIVNENTDAHLTFEVPIAFEVVETSLHEENHSDEEDGNGDSDNPEMPLHNTEKGDDQVIISVAEYKFLKKKVDEYDVLKNNLEQIFTSGQIRCLMKRRPNKRGRVRWSAEDIASALSLRNISPKGYRHLRANIGIPLPGSSTLRKWIGNVKKKPEKPEENSSQ